MATSWIERWRPRWRLLLLCTVAALAGIWLSEPDYTSLQLADDAADFVATVDSPGRAMLAAGFDLLFALLYGTLGIIGLRTHARGRAVAMWGVLAIAVGVAGDEAENVMVLANVAQRASLTEQAVDVMRVFGTVKWVAQLGFLVLAGLALRNLLDDRRARAVDPAR